ncbi:MAG: hypothetical protein ACUVS7_02880 [Bryobacteraceae bacterium]
MADAEHSAAGLASHRSVVIGGTILAAFLIGFLLQYGAARQARSSLQAAESEAGALRQQAALAELRDAAALLLFEVTQRNFGIAAQRATTLFDRIQQVAGGSDPGADGPLREALAARDKVTAGLASADPAVLSEVQRVFLLVQQGTHGR